MEVKNEGDLAKIEVNVGIPFNQLQFGKKLAEGGFGEVWSGMYGQLRVAIKKLKKANLTSEEKEEFKKEARSMIELNSPYIANFYGVSVDNLPFCIVMELVDGGSLYSVLHDSASQFYQKDLSWAQKENFAYDIAMGLSFLHGKNIIHRDLKSHNILVDKEGNARLTDFGLAINKLPDNSFIEGNGIAGTYLWMAPEIFPDSILSTPLYSNYSDIYAYGVILWELAARKLPMSNVKTVNELVQRVKSGKRDSIPKECPQKFAQLITMCWELNPRTRPQAKHIIGQLVRQSKSPKSDINYIGPDLVEDGYRTFNLIRGEHTISRINWSISLVRNFANDTGYIVLEGINKDHLRVVLVASCNKNGNSPNKALITFSNISHNLNELNLIGTANTSCYTWDVDKQEVDLFIALVESEKKRGDKGDINYTTSMSRAIASKFMASFPEDAKASLGNYSDTKSSEELKRNGHNSSTWAIAMIRALGLPINGKYQEYRILNPAPIVNAAADVNNNNIKK